MRKKGMGDWTPFFFQLLGIRWDFPKALPHWNKKDEKESEASPIEAAAKSSKTGERMGVPEMHVVT